MAKSQVNKKNKSGMDMLLSTSNSKEERKVKKNLIGDLEKHFNDFFWGLNDDIDYKESGYGGKVEHGFHPSSLFRIKCERKLVLSYLKADYIEEDVWIEPKLRRIFDMGSYVHNRWQMYLTLMSKAYDNFELIGDWKCKGCGYCLSPKKEIPQPKENTKCPKCKSVRWKYNEFRLGGKLRLVGKRDGKIIWNGETYLLEIKSIGMFPFTKLYQPPEDHIKQFAFYMYLDPEKVRKGFFIYENKNDQDVKIFLYKYNRLDIASDIDRLKVANDFVDRKKFPPRLDGFPNIPLCKKCEFRDTCKQADKTLKPLYKALDKK